MHVHTRDDETFYLLEGEMLFEIISDEVHYLNLCTPAGLDGFFRALSEPAQAMTLPPPVGSPPDIPRFIATAQ